MLRDRNIQTLGAIAIFRTFSLSAAGTSATMQDSPGRTDAQRMAYVIVVEARVCASDLLAPWDLVRPSHVRASHDGLASSKLLETFEVAPYASFCCSVTVDVDDCPLRFIDVRCSELLLPVSAAALTQALLLRPPTIPIGPTTSLLDDAK